MADQDLQGGAASGPPGGVERRAGDRRTGQDRRAGDRRTRESFGGVGHKSGSFFDHPWLVVGTVIFGVLVGMLIMLATSRPTNSPVSRTNLPSGGIDVIVKPDAAP